MAAGLLLVVVDEDVEEGHGSEDECLQGAVQPHEGQRKKREDEDVRSAPESAEKLVVVFLVHPLLHQLQVVWC